VDAGQVLSCPLTGCAGLPVPLSSSVFAPTAIAADDNGVFWLQGFVPAGKSADEEGVARCALSDGGACGSLDVVGTSQHFVAGTTTGLGYIAINAEYVVWTYDAVGLAIASRTGTISQVEKGLPPAERVAIGGTVIYFTLSGTGSDAGRAVGIFDCDANAFALTGSCYTLTPLIPFDDAFDLATYGTFDAGNEGGTLFWSESKDSGSGDRIFRAPLPPQGALTQLLGQLRAPVLAVSPQGVFFAETTGTNVGFVPQTGAPSPKLLAQNQSAPDLIAVTPSSAARQAAFWVSGNSKIIVAPLP
jgi:hypothetical protein